MVNISKTRKNSKVIKHKFVKNKIFFMKNRKLLLYSKVLKYTFLSKYVRLTYTKLSNCQCKKKLFNKIYCIILKFDRK